MGSTADLSIKTFVTSRYMAPTVVGGAFLAMLLIYAFANPLYRPILTVWGVEVGIPPFLDGRAIVSALTCARQGYDVLVQNPCDVLGRVHIYSPLWLVLARLPIDNGWNVPCSIGVDLAFIVALGFLPRARSPKAALAMLAALLSYTVAYAVERANNDLIVFVLTVAVVTAAGSRSRAWRGLGYATAFLAGALKYYPMALFLLALREPIRRCLTIAVLALSASAALIYLGRQQLAEEAATLSVLIGSWNTDSFGIIDLGHGILDIVPALRAPLGRLGITDGGFVALVALAMAAQSAANAARLLGTAEFGAALARLCSRRFLYLVAGAAMMLGCFVTGANINYRGVSLLFTLPGLLVLAGEGAALSGSFRWHVAQIVFVMWSEFFRRSIDLATDGVPWFLANIIRIVFFVALQLVWWRVMALLAAILIAFALTSEACRPLRAWLRLPAPMPPA